MTEITDAMVEAAVLAYDAARCAFHGPGEKPMSERNRETIAPMIRAALTAALSARETAEPVAIRREAFEEAALIADAQAIKDHGDWCNAKPEDKAYHLWAKQTAEAIATAIRARGA